MKSPLVIIASSCVVLAGQLDAQRPSDQDLTGIERAAATFYADRLPSGVRVLESSGRPGRTQSERDSLRALIGAAREATLESVFRCPGNPRTCTLDVDIWVRIHTLEASPDSARVLVEYRYQSGIERQPIARASAELILSKVNGEWKVLRIGRRSAT